MQNQRACDGMRGWTKQVNRIGMVWEERGDKVFMERECMPDAGFRDYFPSADMN